MLYERWQRLVADRKGDIALRDLTSGRAWTFAQLDAESSQPLPGNPALVHAAGNSPEFIFTVLRAWRGRAVVCPVEASGQPPGFSPPPWPCCLLKTTPPRTGLPRAVAFTGEQLAADADNIVSTMGLRPDWPNLGVISLAYSYGFSNLVLPLLLHGIPLFLVPSPLPVALREAGHAHGNLTVAAVPALWHAWHKAGAILENVRLAISAGAPLPLDLEAAIFHEHGVKIHNFYGSTECGGIAYDATEEPRADESCVGRPLKNVAVEEGKDGALWVRSRAVGESYWPKPEASLGGGVFKTRDLGRLDGGAVFLQGRTDDQINIAGRKVSPAQIERALAGHEAVDECVVFAVPGGGAGRMDLIVACVAAARPLARDELKNFLLLKLPAWQVPREWWFVDSIGNGARSRARWRRAFLENRPVTA